MGIGTQKREFLHFQSQVIEVEREQVVLGLYSGDLFGVQISSKEDICEYQLKELWELNC